MSLSRFDLVNNEVNNDSYLKEVKSLLKEKINRGEYPPEELTEDKILKLLIEVITERKTRERQKIYHIKLELSDSEADFYLKVLWVTLEEQRGDYQFIGEKELGDLRRKLWEEFENTV